ncbi:Rhox7b [Phodopus roborovskii]|uniref:Rhox7b protein n=1 Tax=Phodopus roborovskii TaxID=109678 RepID=A0AAU9YZ45_PHORO|nr:Rhox7b [Phodopus roborovskii]
MLKSACNNAMFPRSPLVRHPRRHQVQFSFTQWQVQEMEAVFQETQYPDVLTRRVLARNMNVPEDKIQNWFNNRRAKQRAREKKAMIRRAPPGTQDHICITPMVLAAGEGREEEESGRPSPGCGSPTAEVGGVEPRDTGDSGEGSSAAVTADLMEDWKPEGGTCSSQEHECPLQKPVPKSTGDTEEVQHPPVSGAGVESTPVTMPALPPSVRPIPVMLSDIQPVPVLVPHRRLRDRFTGQQLQELERIFQRNHYLSAEEGKQLARSMGVTEAKLQRWFKKKRERLWRGHHPSGPSTAPPETQSTSP